ncbi:hypothetical protein DSO57_1024567 [Entomophthora muscae]|uniref:Uncharacterized protein n=1 Tax=Entomophthora muscae TaxID=34485 RepID=A0ACC2S4D5_9FUNG|nr:hypothetical protein DSO57_1024567 [Entomophthora muscae]
MEQPNDKPNSPSQIRLPSIYSLLTPANSAAPSRHPSAQLQHPLVSLADASLRNEARRMSVPQARVGCDPVRGRPSIHKSAQKMPKPIRRNFTQRRNTCIGTFDGQTPVMMVPNFYPYPVTRRTSIPGPIASPMAGPVNMARSGRSFLYTHDERLTSDDLEDLVDISSDNPDSKEAHRQKEQRRRDEMKWALHELNLRLEDSPSVPRSKLDILTLAIKKIDDLNHIINSK